MKIRSLVAVGGAVVAGWVGGAATTGAAVAQPLYEHLSLFAEVLGHVEARYVDEVDDAEVVEGAIRGMLGALDPYSVYLTPTEFAAMKSDTEGEYVGIGVSIRTEDEGVRILEVFEGGPAERAGLRAGDLMTQIAGDVSGGFTNEDVMARLRGRRGVAVEVVVVRPGEAEPLTFSVVRDVIEVESVVAAMPTPGYGMIEVRQFQSDVSADVRGAIDRLQADFGAPLRGLVLDLRGDPGGLLTEAVAMADLFISEGTIVTTRGRATPDARHVASRSATRYTGPLAVLMDQGSASASEIVAGALQDSGRALVVGTQSYGKGSVQTIIDLSDGSGLKLTISRYYTPSGRSIHEEGITPDIVVEAGQTDASVTSASGLDLAGVTDPQVRSALEALVTPPG